MMRALKAIAKRGDHTAALICGCLELYGWNYPNISARAMDWIAIAQRNSTPLGLFIMSYCLFLQNGKEDEALDLAKQAVKGGVPEAATLVALIMERGPHSESEVQDWLERAGELGDPWGYYYLGLKCANSQLGSDIAIKWFKMAARFHHAGAMAELGRIYALDPLTADEGLRLTRAAAELGQYSALVDLACYYREGKHGLGVDEELAHVLEARALEQIEVSTKESAF